MNIHFHIGPDGDGSAARPFDGSLSQHFYLHLRHPAEIDGTHHIQLGPGIYLTRGQRPPPARIRFIRLLHGRRAFRRHAARSSTFRPPRLGNAPRLENLRGRRGGHRPPPRMLARQRSAGAPPTVAVVADRPPTAPDTDAAVFIEHLTVDAGWPALPGKPETGHATVRCIAATGGIRLHCHHVTTHGFHPVIGIRSGHWRLKPPPMIFRSVKIGLPSNSI